MGTSEVLGQANRMLETNLRWTSIPSRGSNNIPSRLMLKKPAAMSQFGSKGFTGIENSQDRTAISQEPMENASGMHGKRIRGQNEERHA